MTQSPRTPADPRAAREIFYDGACPICTREIAAYRKIEGMQDASWTDVSASDAAPDGLDRKAALARFHVRTENGEIISGFRAFLAIWRRNRRMRGMARLLDRQPFVALGDMAYGLFLKIRPLWRRA